MVCADVIGLCAILRVGIRAYCLPIEHVHFPGPTGLVAVTLIWVTVQLMKRYNVWPTWLHMCHKYVSTCCQSSYNKCMVIFWLILSSPLAYKSVTTSC